MIRVAFLALLAFILTVSVPAFAKDEGGGEGAKVESPYIELDPLLLPIITDEGITQQVSLVVQLEVKDVAKKADIVALKPKIIDAFVQALYGTLDKDNAVTSKGVLRLDVVKKNLQVVADKIAGPDMVSDVLLQVVQQHRV